MNTDALWINVQQDCETSFKTLYSKFQPELNRYAFNLLKDRFFAEEIVNDVFLKTWENRQTIFSENGSLKGYLYHLLHNVCLNVLKKNNTQKSKMFIMVSSSEWMGLFEAHGVVENCFLEKIKWDEIFAVIGAIIEKMPKQRREIFNLFIGTKMSTKEMAVQMGLSESTIRTHLQLARKEIENFLNSIRH